MFVGVSRISVLPLLRVVAFLLRNLEVMVVACRMLLLVSCLGRELVLLLELRRPEPWRREMSPVVVVLAAR